MILFTNQLRSFAWLHCLLYNTMWSKLINHSHRNLKIWFDMITNSLRFCKLRLFLRGCIFLIKNIGSIRINHSPNINDTISYCLPDYPNPLRSNTELYSDCFVFTSHFHCCNLISIKCTLPNTNLLSSLNTGLYLLTSHS